MDSLTGVGKENVPGIYRFGPKTFIKMWNEYEGNVDDIIEVLGKMFDNTDKLPEGFTSVRDMYEFNLELFRPWTIKDLREDEVELLKKQITEYNGPATTSTILEASYDTFGKLYMPSYKEQSFYGISDDD
jgi:5'-3' exonuclease